MIGLLISLLLSAALPAPGPEPVEQLLQRASGLVRLSYYDEAAELLEGLDLRAENRRQKTAVKLLAARSRLGQGKVKEAAAILDSYRKAKGVAVDGFSYALATRYLGIAEASTGRFIRAEALFDELVGHTHARVFLPELAFQGLEAALRAKNKKQVKAWLKRVSRSGGEKSRRLTAAARALAALGKKPKDECGQLLVDFPCAPLPASCDKLAVVQKLPAKTRFRRARNLFECWGYEEALSEFEHFLTDKAYRAFHLDAHFYVAEVLSRKLRNDRASALEHYTHVYKHSRGRRAYALYQMGRCKMNLELYEEAGELFGRYLDKYPDGEFAERCRYYAGWLPYDHEKLAQAVPGFDAFLRKHRKGSLRSYVIWFRAWSLFRLGKLGPAIGGFKDLIPYGNNIVAGKAYYWTARAHEELGKKKKALAEFRQLIKRYPMSYYDRLSRLRVMELGGEVKDEVTAIDLPAPPRPVPADLAEIVPRRLDAAMSPVMGALYAGETAIARKLFAPVDNEFFRLTRKKSAEARFVAWSLLEEPDKMRAWGRKNLRGRGDYPTSDNRLAWMFEYPEAYRVLIEIEARRNGLPPYFLYSIMRQESRYRRGVTSWADAMGLMQVVPGTGAKTARLNGVPFSRRELFTPELNIKLAAAYLGALNRDMRGQLVLVAASYNAGPVAVRQFLETNRGQDFDFFIEEIAYNEARNYCRKVAGHVVAYLATYAPPGERPPVVERLFPAAVNYEVGKSVGY